MDLVVKASKAVIDLIRTGNLLDDLLYEAARAELKEKVRELDAAFMRDRDAGRTIGREKQRTHRRPRA